MEVIVHDTPTEKLNTREFRHTTHHLNEIIPFLIAEKENAMRNAVEYAWTYGNLEEIQHYFGYTVNEKHGKPGNAEFVMLMAEHLREDPVPCCDEHMH